MSTRLSRISFFLLIGLALVSSGCLVSGTFVVVEEVDFDFTADTGFYWYPVDLTGNSVWEDHADDIDNIDALGMQFQITNTSDVETTFRVSFAKSSVPIMDAVPPDEIPSNAVVVIDGLTVAAGATRNIGYAGSLAYIGNIEKFKEVIMSGRFDYFGESTGGTDDYAFEVRDGKIVVTISASST